MTFHTAKIKKSEGGQVMLTIVILFLAASVIIILGIATPILKQAKISVDEVRSQESYYLAEGSLEDSYYRLAQGKTVTTGDSVTLDGSSATTAITTTPTGKKIVITASVNNDVRKMEADLVQSTGIAFNYGLQAGNGGVTLGGGSTIKGNIYSNAAISAISATITGTAVAVSGTLGGATYSTGLMVGDSSSHTGDAWAPTVKGTTAYGTIYCSSGLNNSQSCTTSKGTPPTQDLPFTDANIQSWKDAAAAGGTITGDETIDYRGGTLGPKKITGNLLVSGGGTLTLSGPLWVQGTVTITGGGRIQLPSNYGKNSESIVSDGTITIAGGGSAGSGTAGSYLFLVSTSACPSGTGCSGNSAINITGGAGAIAANAQSGNVALSGGASISAVVGNSITVTGGSTVTYDNGLASPSFSSGPSGGYIISGWQEVQ